MPLARSIGPLVALCSLGLGAAGLWSAERLLETASVKAAAQPLPATAIAAPVPQDAAASAPGSAASGLAQVACLDSLELDAAAFERWLAARFETSLAGSTWQPLSDTERMGLQAALEGPAQRATRAVLILARCQEPWAGGALLHRLETRSVFAERWEDAGDQAAAAALARIPLEPEQRERLYALVDGPKPHPDLEVRTECAIAALAHGEQRAIGFLLRVLRIDTPSADREGPITASPTTAWPRGRAAEALCRVAGVPFSDWSDQPLVDREAAADRLEALLQGR
jgi:hypothetical protein